MRPQVPFIITRPKTRPRIVFQYRSWGRDPRTGLYTLDKDWIKNLVPNEGETFLLDVITGRTTPANIYMGLTGDATSPYADPFAAAAETDTLATWAAFEFAVAAGYARAAVARNTTDWPNAPVAGAPSSVTAARKTFTATGAIGTAYHAFLCSVASGTAGVALSYSGVLNGGAGRLLSQSGDAAGIDYTLTLD